MSFIVRLWAFVYIYDYVQRKKIKRVEKEKGVIGSKGIKGVRDTFREIDERVSKNKSID